mmetsp:Transcript_49185/g.157271  ORF Transcript_49185/g.157271 Transcript_49185/m.157271 type:complete len:449 (-) Transcript_49185:116-1462(-)
MHRVLQQLTLEVHVPIAIIVLTFANFGLGLACREHQQGSSVRNAFSAAKMVGIFADDVNLFQVALERHPMMPEKVDEPGIDEMNMMQISLNTSGRAARWAVPAVAQGASEGRMFAVGVPRAAAGVAGDARVVWLSVAALAVVLLKVKWRDRGEAWNSAAPCSELESFTEKLRDCKEILEPELPQEQQPTRLVKVPSPTRRLRHIGASFVIPFRSIKRCSTEVLSFDIPMLPCVWPLHAVLMRSGQEGPWVKIELTVDIFLASGLPPLLSCSVAAAAAPAEGCGGTGGTGSCTPEGSLNARRPLLALGTKDCTATARDSGVVTNEAEHTNDGIVAHDGSCGGSSDGSGKCPWLKIHNGSGALVASIMPLQEGICIVQRQDTSSWDIAVHLGDQKPWMTVSKGGREISQATSLGSGTEEHLQVDTQPDTQSPESALLLMCMLAILVFGER